MNALPYDRCHGPVAAVRDLVAEHGFRPVLLAVLGLGVRPRRLPAAPDVDQLSDHLRRDIGLPPLGGRRDGRWAG